MKKLLLAMFLLFSTGLLSADIVVPKNVIILSQEKEGIYSFVSVIDLENNELVYLVYEWGFIFAKISLILKDVKRPGVFVDLSKKKGASEFCMGSVMKSCLRASYLDQPNEKGWHF